MKKILSLTLALCMLFALAACGDKTQNTQESAPAAQTQDSGTTTTTTVPVEPAANAVEPDLNYTIRIYSNSNSTERTTWLINEAKAAGFNISIDDNSVISGDTAAVQAA
ncbi:MAG: hypothetical protein E7422_11050, partial [Ruminococcaceae bacterium]|nr:hypothetical protein [Oscillospiraceae bacterium]